MKFCVQIYKTVFFFFFFFFKVTYIVWVNKMPQRIIDGFSIFFFLRYKLGQGIVLGGQGYNKVNRMSQNAADEISWKNFVQLYISLRIIFLRVCVWGGGGGVRVIASPVEFCDILG